MKTDASTTTTYTTTDRQMRWGESRPDESQNRNAVSGTTVPTEPLGEFQPGTSCHTEPQQGTSPPDGTASISISTSKCPDQSVLVPMTQTLAPVQNLTTDPETPAPERQRALTLLSDDTHGSTVKCPAEEAALIARTEAEAEAAPSEPDASPGTKSPTPKPEDIPGTTLRLSNATLGTCLNVGGTSTQCTALHSRPEPTAGTRLAPSGEDSAELDACADTGGTPPQAEVARRNYNAVMQLAKTGYERFHKLPADQITDEHVTE